MPNVKAKFRCNSIMEEYNRLHVHMDAVYDKEGENADYAKSTPAGHLSIVVDKDTLAAQTWQRGDYFYLHFEKAENA